MLDGMMRAMNFPLGMLTVMDEKQHEKIATVLHLASGGKFGKDIYNPADFEYDKRAQNMPKLIGTVKTKGDFYERRDQGNRVQQITDFLNISNIGQKGNLVHLANVKLPYTHNGVEITPQMQGHLKSVVDLYEEDITKSLMDLNETSDEPV